MALGLGALVAVVLVAILVIVWFVDPNSFKPRIETAVRDATGRDFALVGDIDLGFFPWLALRTGEGSFGNAPGFGAEPMVSWKSAQLGARLIPLLRGRLVADRVILEGADVRLVRHADGRANWQGIGGSGPADPNAEPMDLRIDGVRIEDSSVSFVDETVPRRVSVTALNLSTDGISPGKPYTDSSLSGVLHMDGFAAAGAPFKLDIPKAVVPEDMSSVDVPGFRIEFGDFEAAGGARGTLGDKPKLAGMLESNAFDLRALLATIGVQPPKTTDAAALGKVQFAADWRFDAGAIAIEPLSLTLDDTHLKGSFRRGVGENALGQFSLRGDSLDIARYIPPADPNSEPFVLPTAALKQLQFRGDLQLEQATLGDIAMKGVTLRLLLDEQGLRPMQPETAEARQ
ncbi:MAG TPA: AsmA family protein [Steroidobacteraceae bacterium]|nr:AsmA family protein [Steroidobacteraceae bacterium]